MVAGRIFHNLQDVRFGEEDQNQEERVLREFLDIFFRRSNNFTEKTKEMVSDDLKKFIKNILSISKNNKDEDINKIFETIELKNLGEDDTWMKLKSIIIQNLLTPRDVKHFANKLINHKDQNWLKDPDQLNNIIQETIDSQVFPSL